MGFFFNGIIRKRKSKGSVYKDLSSSVFHKVGTEGRDDSGIRNILWRKIKVFEKDHKWEKNHIQQQLI